jgi:hypothetical protein
LAVRACFVNKAAGKLVGQIIRMLARSLSAIFFEKMNRNICCKEFIAVAF